MTYEEKALIILKSMEKNIQVDWNMEKFYIDPIIAGIKEIERKDKKAQSVDIQEFLSRLKGTYESAQEISRYVATVADMTEMHAKIEARKELIGDVLDELNLVGLITDKEALKWAESFDVEI